jgi:hypothetical protein
MILATGQVGVVLPPTGHRCREPRCGRASRAVRS